MSSKLRNKQLLIGMPETGKTTFLAALWHVVISEEVPGSLKLVRLEGNREHINNIHEDWLECRTVDRTKFGNEQFIAMRLAPPDNYNETEIIFTDLSGERFREQWKERKWTRDFDELARQSIGAFLFIHPRRVVEPVRIDAATIKIVAAALGDTVEEEERDEINEWDPEKTPTQVQLVELLQFIASQSYLEHLSKIAIIISAWDLLDVKYKNPHKWLAQRLPLLDQYLNANPERFTFKVFGVSAQGGDLVDEKGRHLDSVKELQRKMKAAERIIVVDGDQRSNDITIPIKWVMDWGAR